MDNKQGVCLFYQRTGTCKLGDQCPLSHVREERGITTKYDDRVWQHAQASTSGSRPEQPRRRRSTSSRQQEAQSQEKVPEQMSKWNFRVMTYNILAEGLATAHGELLYQQVPHWCLNWNYRWPGLLAEIVHYKPDVMSLQEVDHFDELANRLGPLGYEGRYAQRSGGRSDGCATFWRKDIFIAVAVDIIRFQSYGLQDNVALLVLLHRKASFPDGDDPASEGVVEVRMTVDESGDVSLLSGEVQKWFRLHAELPVETLMDPALLVANTHILFNPKRGDIKIAQLRTLLNVMNDVVRKCNGNALGMVMGDFNSTPQSAVYQFIKAGELDCQTVPRKHVSGQVQGTSWPAALEKMARQRSAPPALSVESIDSLLTPPATPSSPHKSEFWGSPPQKSPTHRNPRKKPLRAPGVAGGAAKGLSRGMKHVASEPQLCALDGSGEYGSIARSIVEPLKLTAHTVPAMQTLPDTEPPLVASSSASSPRQQPDSAPAKSAGTNPLAPQLKMPQRPNSLSGPPSAGPLDPATAAVIAKAVHNDDASVLDDIALSHVESSKHLSTTSLSTIAESGSDVANSNPDLSALDQVAEKLCELAAANPSSPSAASVATDRSSFEFDTKQDRFSSSPAQVPGFPEPGNLALHLNPLSARNSSEAQRTSHSSDYALQSRASGSYGPVNDQPGIATAVDARTRASADVAQNIGEPGNRAAHDSVSSAVGPLDKAADSVILRREDWKQPGEASDNAQTGSAQRGRKMSEDSAFSVQDSALFAPAFIKPRVNALKRDDSFDSSPGSRKLKQIPSDSEIEIHASPADGHQTPFTPGPNAFTGPEPALPASPGISVKAAAAAAAAAAFGNSKSPRGSADGLPPKPFSPPLHDSLLGDSKSPRGSSEALPPRPFSPPSLPPWGDSGESILRKSTSLERRSSLDRPPRPFSPPGPIPLGADTDLLSPRNSLEQRNSSSHVLSPTSKLAADIGIFSPRRLPPKLQHTRASNDPGHLSSGDRQKVSLEKPRQSGDKPRSGDSRGPPIVRKPLFRDDSCTWSPEQLQMAVGFPTAEEDTQAIDRAASLESPGTADPSAQDPEPTWVARHPLKLRSAYSEVTGSEPPYTTCHSKFLGTVDYMWYTPNQPAATPLKFPGQDTPVLEVRGFCASTAWKGNDTVVGSDIGQADKGTTLLPTKTLIPPPLEHLYCGLPSPEWQSDHMSLVTDFSVQRAVSKNSILLSGLHKEKNMVRARSKLVDSEVFAAALAAVNRNSLDRPKSGDNS